MFSKVVFNILGTMFLLVGVLGVVLPLLPATPFLLLASACYVRGSTTLHNWLMSHRYLGPYITNIKDKRGMPIKAKIITITVLWLSLLFSMYRVDSLLLDSTLLIVGIGVTALILKLKTLERN
ncbi:MAG: YbaN family protein [Acidobacteriota bacterium]